MVLAPVEISQLWRLQFEPESEDNHIITMDRESTSLHVFRSGHLLIAPPAFLPHLNLT